MVVGASCFLLRNARPVSSVMLGLLLKLLGCGLTCLRTALVLNVGEAEVELDEFRVELITT